MVGTWDLPLKGTKGTQNRLIRTAKIKTATALLDRPMTKLFLLNNVGNIKVCVFFMCNVFVV